MKTKDNDNFKFSIYFIHKETGITRNISKEEGEILLKIDSIYLPNLNDSFIFAQLEKTKLSFFEFCSLSYDDYGVLYKVEKCFTPKNKEFYFNLFKKPIS